MSWAAVTMRWPAQATQWLEGLDVAKGLASAELVSTALRLGDLDGLATTAVKAGPSTRSTPTSSRNRLSPPATAA